MRATVILGAMWICFGRPSGGREAGALTPGPPWGVCSDRQSEDGGRTCPFGEQLDGTVRGQLSQCGAAFAKARLGDWSRGMRTATVSAHPAGAETAGGVWLNDSPPAWQVSVRAHVALKAHGHPGPLTRRGPPVPCRPRDLRGGACPIESPGTASIFPLGACFLLLPVPEGRSPVSCRLAVPLCFTGSRGPVGRPQPGSR